MKVKVIFRSRFIPFVIACSVVAGLPFLAFGQWPQTSRDVQCNVLLPTGAASEHKLKLTIQTNGNISVTGYRYDFASTSVIPSQTNGTLVSKASSPVSQLGPATNTTNVFKWTNGAPLPSGAFTNVVLTNMDVRTERRVLLSLSDGTKLRGYITSYKHTDQSLNGVNANNVPVIVTRTNFSGFNVERGSATYAGASGNWFDIEN